MTEPREPIDPSIRPTESLADDVAKEKAYRPAGGGKTPDPVKWLNIAVLVLLAGVGMTVIFGLGPDEKPGADIVSPDAKTDVTQLKTQRFQEVTGDQRQNIMGRMIPALRDGVSADTLRAGKGMQAQCGQTVNYRLLTGFGKDEKASQTKTLQLGDIRQPIGLTLGLLGIQAGEVRQLSVPNSLWKPDAPRRSSPLPGEADRTVLFVEALDVSPPIPEAKLAPRRFGGLAGEGFDLRCGDAALLHVTIARANGEILFDSRADNGLPIYAELGASQLPLGLELGVLGMAPGATNTLLLPPEWMRRLQAALPSVQPEDIAGRAFPEIQTPEEEWVIVDVAYPARSEYDSGENVNPTAEPKNEPVTEPSPKPEDSGPILPGGTPQPD